MRDLIHFNGMLIQNNTRESLDLVKPIGIGVNKISTGFSYKECAPFEVHVVDIDYPEDMSTIVTCKDGKKYQRLEHWSPISPFGWKEI